MIKKMVVFASGEGTNAKAILEHFENTDIKVVGIVCDRPEAGVMKVADDFGVPCKLINKDILKDSTKMLEVLKDLNGEIDLIVLAGFMRIIPKYLIEFFPNKIVNIHPSIDKKHDGKTGDTIHDDVLKEAQEKPGGEEIFHGSRVHYVASEVDEGETIDSESFKVDRTWTKEELLKVVKKIEHSLYPRAIKTIFSR